MFQEKDKGEVGVIEWLFPPLQPRTTLTETIDTVALLIKQGCEQTVQMTGEEPRAIYLALKNSDLEWYLQHAPSLQEALLENGGTIAAHPTPSFILRWMPQYQWLSVPKLSTVPLAEGITIYTDARRKSRTAAAVWQEKGQWCQKVIPAEPEDTLQTLELVAVSWALITWKDVLLNIVTNSLYVPGIGQRIELAQLWDLNNCRLHQLLLMTKQAVQQRTVAYAILHI